MASAAPASPVCVSLEACLLRQSRKVDRKEECLVPKINSYLFQTEAVLEPGALIDISHDDFLSTCLATLRVGDDCPPHTHHSSCKISVFVYRLHTELPDEEPLEDVTGEISLPSCEVMELPNASLEGRWESLHFDPEAVASEESVAGGDVKGALLAYTEASRRLSVAGVDTNVVAYNRVILFHGPPGTGKTSLSKALAHKLSIRWAEHYSRAQLVEVNAHSLFSRWFSESGKQVLMLFRKVREMVEDRSQSSLVFVLIDEVESLAAARKAALNGSEPSDAIRVVNALLTQLDSLKRFNNVFVLATSNIAEAIDLAFIDRADLKIKVGNPALGARVAMLSGATRELQRCGIVSQDGEQTVEGWMANPAKEAEGLSGRTLMKLPLLAFVRAGPQLQGPVAVSLPQYVALLLDVIRAERGWRDREHLM